MPIYEYQCQQCNEKLERLQRMNDDPLTDCPACGESALKRLISAAGFRLKGAGWYETDFKKDGKRNLADSGDSAPSKSSNKKDTGSSKASDTKASKPATDSKSA